MTVLRRVLRGFALATALLVLVVVLVRAFVGDIYHITSSSMEPTLRQGEWVFVRYAKAPPQRFELAVFRRADRAIVKRVVGLPGDEIAITAGGDLLIDGEGLHPDETRPRPILMFDSRRLDLAEHFRMGGSTQNPWTKVGDYWELDARTTEAHAAAGLIGPRLGVHDGWLWADGTVQGLEPHQDVGDLIVEAELVPIERGGRIVLRLDEQGDVFRFALELEENEGRATIARHAAGDVQSLEVLAEARLPLRYGKTMTLTASNVDNHLNFDSADGTLGLHARYVKNRVHPRAEGGLPISPGERVQLGGEGSRLRLGRVRIWRDLHYTPVGEFATRRPLLLGPGEFFLLGDNSRSSRDGREWGPTSQTSLYGRAVRVVWPPSAMRALSAVAEGQSENP